MSRIFRLRDGSALDLLGLVAVAILLATLVFVAVLVSPLAALYKSPPARSTGSRDATTTVAKFRASTDRQTTLFDNRSWFFDPKPPTADVASTHTPAKNYGGPTILAYIDGTAWFSDGEKLSEKEPRGRDLKLLRANPPWTITVEWDGGRFDVDLFKRITAADLRDSTSSSSFGSFSSPFGSTGYVKPAAPRIPSDRADIPAAARSGPGALGPNAASEHQSPGPAGAPGGPPGGPHGGPPGDHPGAQPPGDHPGEPPNSEPGEPAATPTPTLLPPPTPANPGAEPAPAAAPSSAPSETPKEPSAPPPPPPDATRPSHT